MTDNQSNSEKKKNCESRNYHRTMMLKNMIIEKLRDQGCRITKQRVTIDDNTSYNLSAKKLLFERRDYRGNT